MLCKHRNATFAQNKGDYRNYQCKINIENYMKRWFNDRERGKLCFFFGGGRERWFELLGAKCVTVAVYRFGGIEYGDSLCGTNRNVYDVMAT